MSTSASFFAILGATGHVGGRAARQLLASGHKVRAIVRDSTSPAAAELQKLGAELFEVKSVDASPFSTNESQLTLAFSSVDGAFILVPPHGNVPNPEAEARQYIDSVKRAVVASQIKKVVFLSSVAAHLPSGTGVIEKLHYLEQEFNAIAKDAQIAIVYVRAGYFFTNTLGSLAAVPHGIYPGSVINGDVKIPFISTDDIGDQVTKSLLDRSVSTGEARVIELSGPEDLTHNQLVAIISEIVGKDIAYAPIPKADQQKTFEGFGLSPAGATAYIALGTGLDNGIITYEKPESVVRGNTHVKDFLTAALKK